jgi:hypothetical protein
MDYEKKYNEALERAKMILCNLGEGSGNIRDIESIFPELTESEDERIRKWLLDYAVEMIAGLESDISLSTYDGIKGHDPEAEAELAQWQKARAYFEKQKEQKPAEWSEEDEKLIEEVCRCLCEYAGYYKEKDMEAVNNHLFKLSQRLKSLPMRCPKKSDNWKPSEDEERLINTSISFLKDFADKGYENAIECIDWLKSKLNGNACK